MNLEEIKKFFLEKYYNFGDFTAFEFLDNAITCNKILDNNIVNELMEILPILFRLNYLEIEFENGTYNKKVYNTLVKYNINDFYIEIKDILFYDILKIKEEDLQIF